MNKVFSTIAVMFFLIAFPATGIATDGIVIELTDAEIEIAENTRTCTYKPASQSTLSCKEEVKGMVRTYKQVCKISFELQQEDYIDCLFGTAVTTPKPCPGVKSIEEIMSTGMGSCRPASQLEISLCHSKTKTPPTITYQEDCIRPLTVPWSRIDW